MPVDRAEFTAALGQYASGVCLLTVRDGIDDVGTTVSSVMSVSASPPLIAVGLSADGYPAEVLEEVGRCGLTILAADELALHEDGAQAAPDGDVGDVLARRARPEDDHVIGLRAGHPTHPVGVVS